MTNQNDLQAVIDRAKADIARKYVYVMMPIPQIETLLKGVEEAQDEAEKWKAEAKRQYILFNAELDITRKLREALEDADAFDPTRARFEMDANGNLTRIEDTK